MTLRERGPGDLSGTHRKAPPRGSPQRSGRRSALTDPSRRKRAVVARTGLGLGAANEQAATQRPAPRCGDGVREGVEGCDPPGAPCRALGRSGTCSASCRCVPNASVCGNGAREPGEPCDPPAIDCPPATACQPSTCTCVPVAVSEGVPARPTCGDWITHRGSRNRTPGTCWNPRGGAFSEEGVTAL